MLIESLTANNFRKYQQLELTDLPSSGVITISGLNESGKSSIGEMICFALFGRTFHLSDTNLTKLIRWESDKSTVELLMNDGQGQRYKIQRSIDTDGNSSAQLLQLLDGREKQLATGNDATTKSIQKRLGYEFTTFTDSFYLIARDLSNPDPDSNSIKQMAGIAEYAKIRDELLTATEEDQESIASLLPQISTRQAQLDRLDIDETWLPELVDAKEVVTVESEQKQQFCDELKVLSQQYSQQKKQYRRTRGSWHFFNLLTWLLAPLMLIAWGLWIAFNFFPAQLKQLAQFPQITPHLPTLQTWVYDWGFQSTMALILCTSLMLFFKWRAEYKNDVQLEKAEVLASTLARANIHSQRALDGLITARMRQILQGKIQPQSALSSPPQDEQQSLSKLVEQSQYYTASETAMDTSIQRLLATLTQQDQELEQLAKPLDQKILEEKTRSDEAGVIRSGLRELQYQVARNQQHIKAQETGVKLLHRASDALINEFNECITHRTEKTMPLFTESRYKQIRISSDLSVHVYSDEKMDWVDFDELSSGTQRQILLAVRIAMSEQLALNTHNSQQFIFLDEPFTYFDQERTKAALAALPNISDTTCQIWIVAQEFPLGSHSDKPIHCPGNEPTLSA